MRILVVEDHQPICFALETLLDLEGHSATCVENCDRGLEALVTQDFDVILLDLSVEGISPDDFTQRVRVLYQSRPQPAPLIGIFSADLLIVERARQLEADFWVRKPFNYEDLLEKIESFATARVPSSENASLLA